MASNLYSLSQLDKIAASSQVAAECVEHILPKMVPGATTKDLDRETAEFIASRGARPSFLHYSMHGKPPFPANACWSVNSCVVHGLPSDIPLKSGDVVTFDVGVFKDGFYSDTAWTRTIGTEELSPLETAGIESLRAAIEQVRPGNTVANISRAIQNTARAAGFDVVKEFVGHGVGLSLHEEPHIKNHFEISDTQPGRRVILKPGMCFAIEPILVSGSNLLNQLSDDEWPIVLADKGIAVHFEHTVAVFENECRILTNGRFPGWKK